MDTKKFMAVFAVLVMAFAATACIVSAESDSGAVALEDQGTVTLDVDKDYKGNAEELKKLGINSKASWKEFSKDGYDGYKLVLDDVVYETKDPTALKVKSSNNKVLFIECNGVNKFVSKGLDSNGDTTCIDAGMKTVGICFLGDGELTAICENRDAMNSIAIYASLLGVEGCTLNAMSSDLEITTAKAYTDYLSYAICLMEKGGMEMKNAKVYAESGSIISKDSGKKYATYVSCGLSSLTNAQVLSFVMVDSYLSSVAGDVEAPNANFTGSRGARIGGEIDIENSQMYCKSGNVSAGEVGSDFSEGLFFENEFTAKGSVIYAESGTVYADSLAGQAGAFSTGIQCNIAGGNMTLEDTYFFAYGGKTTVKTIGSGKYVFSSGMIFQSNEALTVSLKGSIVDTAAGSGTVNAYGFVIMTTAFEITQNGKVAITDSEFTATGSTRALAVSSIECQKTPKWCEYEVSGKWHDAKTIEELIQESATATSVSLGFNYYVCLKSSDDESCERVVEKITDDEFTLPECPFDAPDGKRFDCWKVDGKKLNPGDTIEVEYYAVATATWKDVSSGNNNTMAIAIGIIGVAAIAAVGALMIFVPKH